MKKYLILIALIICAACSKDDEPQNNNPLIGIWENAEQYDIWEDDIRIDSIIFTFNANWTFCRDRIVLENDSIVFQNISKGTYGLYDKNKLVVHITYDYNSYSPDADTNEDIYDVAPFTIGRDAKGEYLMFYDFDDDKYYKKIK